MLLFLTAFLTLLLPLNALLLLIFLTAIFTYPAFNEKNFIKIGQGGAEISEFIP
jgi:hypothetical protein